MFGLFIFGGEQIIAALSFGLPAAIVNALSPATILAGFPAALVGAIGTIGSAAILMGLLK